MGSPSPGSHVEPVETPELSAEIFQALSCSATREGNAMVGMGSEKGRKGIGTRSADWGLV